MRLLLASTALVTSFIFPTSSFASQSSCIEAYVRTDHVYNLEFDKLKRLEVAAAGGLGVGALSYCLVKTRRVLACAVILVPPLIVGGAYYSEKLGAKVNRLEDAHALLQTYLEIKRGDLKGENAQSMFSEYGVQSSEEEQAAKIFLTSMENGKLCEGGRALKRADLNPFKD